MNPKCLPVLVTGATGMIGSRICSLLLAAGIPVLAFVRNKEKAHKVLGEHALLTYQIGDIQQPFTPKTALSGIIHGASPTSSKTFISDPVGTIETCVMGTKNTLEIARSASIPLVYLSSGEIYGLFSQMTLVKETDMGYLDPFQDRSCYPEAKRLCESLCAAYTAQYGVRAVVARLGVTFGPATDQKDNRLIQQFARCVKEKRNLILHTLGETIRSYCYVDDAARAIILLLEKGTSQAYNVANPHMTLSVRQIAESVCSLFPWIHLLIENKEPIETLGYLPTLQMQLDVTRILALGWEPQVDFQEGFHRLLQNG